MASVIVTVQLIAFTLMAVIGSVGNLTTFIALQRFTSLKSKFDTTTIYLMTHLAADGLVLCAVSMPGKIYNTVVGGQWPFSVPTICWLTNLSVWPMSYVAIWHMLALTMTRFTATFFAYKHDALMASRALQLCMHLVPYVLAFGSHIFGAFVVYLYDIRPTKGAGICFSMAIDPKSSADRSRAVGFAMFNTLFDTLIPLAIQCAVYVAIFVKLHALRRKRRRTVVATATAAAVSGAAGSAAIAKTGASAQNNRKSNTKGNPAATAAVGSARHAHAVRFLAAVFGVEFLLIFPNQFLYAIGVKGMFLDTLPGLAAALEIMYFAQFVLNPIVYALCSPTMRLAYKRLLLPEWLCCNCWQPKSSDAIEGAGPTRTLVKTLPMNDSEQRQQVELAMRGEASAAGLITTRNAGQTRLDRP